MKTFIIFLALFMALASAMDIKQFEGKYHEEFATREEEAEAAKVLAKNDAQIDLQNTLYSAGLANFGEGELYVLPITFIGARPQLRHQLGLSSPYFH